MNRNIHFIHCSCGGTPIEVDTTDGEEELWGCGRKGCCVEAYYCPQCNTRWTFSLEAPEAE